MQKWRKNIRSEETGTVRRRGRPRAFDRAAALEKAMLLFWRKGYEATSISDLTEAMGIGSPSLYAAFGPKEALYSEALRHYRETFDPPVWDLLESVGTVREAIERYLMDAAAGLAPGAGARPAGCMVTLSSVSCDEHPDLHELMRCERAVNLDRLKARLGRAVQEGELPASADIHALARFVQSVQFGMSILARDGATRDELEAVARLSMEGWDRHLEPPKKPTRKPIGPSGRAR